MSEELEPVISLDCCGKDLKSLEAMVMHTAQLLQQGNLAMAQLYNEMAVKAPKDAKILKLQSMHFKGEFEYLQTLVLPDEVTP